MSDGRREKQPSSKAVRQELWHSAGRRRIGNMTRAFRSGAAWLGFGGLWTASRGVLVQGVDNRSCLIIPSISLTQDTQNG